MYIYKFLRLRVRSGFRVGYKKYSVVICINNQWFETSTRHHLVFVSHVNQILLCD